MPISSREQEIVSLADRKRQEDKTNEAETNTSVSGVIAFEMQCIGVGRTWIDFPMYDLDVGYPSNTVMHDRGRLMRVYKLADVNRDRKLQLQLVDNQKRHAELELVLEEETMLLAGITFSVVDEAYVVESFPTKAKTAMQLLKNH